MPVDRIDEDNGPEHSDAQNGQTAVSSGIDDVRTAIPGALDRNALQSIQLNLPQKLVEQLSQVLAQESPADYPAGVDPHLASHRELLDRLLSEPSDLKTLLQVFIKHHDLAYSDTELNLVRDKDQLLKVFVDNAMIAGYTATEAEAKADEAYAFIMRAENQNYTINKILLHGTGSIVAGMRRLQAAGVPEEQAKGLSYIFAAHHPGYPIDMVRNFVPGGDVPPDLCPILFICSKEAAQLSTLQKKKYVQKAVLTPQEEEELTTLQGMKDDPAFDASANQLRKRILDVGAQQAGIQPEQARAIGLLGYALDRITPSRRMRDIQIDAQGIVATDTKGNVQTSGEAQKKYPLIVRNFTNLADATHANIFAATVTNVRKERDAFINAFREIDPALDPLSKQLCHASDNEISALEAVQEQALAFGKTHIGVTGHLTNMIQDLSCLRARYREMLPDDPNREACAYMIAVLQSIQMNPMTHQKMRELWEVVARPGETVPADAPQDPLIRDLANATSTLRRGSRRKTMLNCVIDFVKAHPEFAKKLQRRKLKEGEVILGQGQENGTVFLMLSGSGKPVVYKEGRTKEGQIQRRLIDRMAFPNIAGELSLLNEGKATADVVIEGGDIEAVTITVNDFHQLMKTEGFEEAFQSLARQRLLAYVTKAEFLTPEEGADVLTGVLEEGKESMQEHHRSILERVVDFARKHPDAGNMFLRKVFDSDSRIITESPSRQGKERDLQRSVYFVVKGRVGIYRRSSFGDPIFLGMSDPGSTIGEMAHFSADGRRSATATAEEDGTVVLEMGEEQFQAMLKENRALTVRLQQLAKRRGEQQGMRIVTGPEVEIDWRAKFSRDILEDPVRRRETIREINDLYPGGVPAFEQCQFTIIGRAEDGIVTVDSEGRVYFEEITRDNAREVLARFKASPAKPGSRNRYELLRECMWRNQEIHTTEAYTNNTLPIGDKDGRKSEIGDVHKWIPQRHAVREEILETWRRRIVVGHEKMTQAIAEKEGLDDLQGKKILVLLSGNTASGKSYTVKHAPDACKRIGLLDIDPDCAINPDEMKAAIRGQELVNGIPQITSNQAHTEGAQMAEELIRWATKQNMHIVIDKRLTKPSEVREVTDSAQGYHTIMVDVDAELQTSLDRVYGNPTKGIRGRDPNGTAPIPPRNVVEGGYTESVLHRRDKAKLVHAINGEYWLLKSDIPGEKQAVLLMQHKADEAEPVRNANYPMLVEHAMQAPEGMAFSRKCLATIKGMSRTIGKGVIDTSATAEKAHSITVTGDAAEEFARLNFQCVVERVYAERNRIMESPQDVRVFIEMIAKEINRGILKKEVLYRTADSTKFPYTAIAKLPEAMEDFCGEFYRRLHDPNQDPIALAAWVEYSVDLTDHFFEDGCGKIAKVLSAWVLARASDSSSVTLPEYRGRDEYYEFIKDRDMLNERNWETYYRTFFPREAGIPKHWEGKRKDLAAIVQDKHRGMRSGGRPDWQHCIDVTCDLEAALSLDADVLEEERETLLLASLGHDLYEDTDANRGDIASRFGQEVDQKITALTNPAGDTSVAAYLAQIHAADEAVKIIKLGDMLDNYRSVLQDTKRPPTKRQLSREWFLQFFLPIVEPMFAQMEQESFRKYPKAARFLLLQIRTHRAELLSQFPEFSSPS
jgi:CRP-like cAMP-binding protein/predicted kinase